MLHLWLSQAAAKTSSQPERTIPHVLLLATCREKQEVQRACRLGFFMCLAERRGRRGRDISGYNNAESHAVGTQILIQRYRYICSEKQEVQNLLARLLDVSGGEEKGRSSPDLNLIQKLSLVEEGSLLLAERLQSAESGHAQVHAPPR